MKAILFSSVLVLITLDVVLANPCAKPPPADVKQCCEFPMPLEGALVESCMNQYGAQSMRVIQSILTGGPPRGAVSDSWWKSCPHSEICCFSALLNACPMQLEWSVVLM